ncbi:cytochrome-c peroxidase [Pseudohongiella sp.]|uniref:Cytochrome c domain-containing protein n=1 Tax=marine sediment metagenome TaxID=412755 RepID=A0A0F9VH18_9ZZZZ|nr:cytochrome c peroxidase [Pseudohongiella sp.]HDZ08899.1 cytochrome-c peroxidase [Pseudohongiella sp.]HEA64023.1 cytochrome-c peroxidase [Pseudohongiella sp.]
MHRKKLTILLVALGLTPVLAYLAWQHVPAPLPARWSPQEVAILQSLALQSLPPLPPDPGNAVADDPGAAELGHHLFFDTRLSITGNVACATCHQPEHHFTDQLQLGKGIAEVDRNTMSLVGTAYSPWLFWDGRKDSLWAQALEPLENPLEHGSNRSDIVALIRSDTDYRQRYESVFGRVPSQQSTDQVFANVGKALSAYQRRLLPGATAFDDYVAGLDDAGELQPNTHMSTEELAGLRLFITKADCTNCHNGPLLTNNSFHNTAVLAAPGMLPAMGRTEGLRRAQADPFNCLGDFSGAGEGECQELRFAKGGDDMIGAQRTPSLRDVSKTAPYMHAGQITDLARVIEHYNEADLAMIGHNEAKPLGLRAVEKKQLESFLRSLTAPLATDPHWLEPPESLPQDALPHRQQPQTPNTRGEIK